MPTNAPPPVETIPISRLFCSPTNPRKNDLAIPHVAASRFGWQQPIVARRTGEVIAGNTRLKAAQGLGMTKAPSGGSTVATSTRSPFNIADNRTHEFAEWHDAELAKLLEHLKTEDALNATGYTEDDLDAMLAAGRRCTGGHLAAREQPISTPRQQRSRSSCRRLTPAWRTRSSLQGEGLGRRARRTVKW